MSGVVVDEKTLEALLQEYVGLAGGKASAFATGYLSAGPLAQVCRREKNSRCYDCGAPAPDWASLQLGVLVCIMCSGIHRSMGTHITMVLSTRLDAWTREQEEEFSQRNAAVDNGELERHVPVHYRRPVPSDAVETRHRFIIAKYHGRFKGDWSSNQSSEAQAKVAALRQPSLDFEEQSPHVHRRSTASTVHIGMLVVHLLGGKKLKAMDFTGKSDPYVVLKCNGQERKSSVRRQTLNPKYTNERFEFNVKALSDVLVLSVFDKDFGSADDFMGDCTLRIDSLVSGMPTPRTLELTNGGKGALSIEATFYNLEAAKK